MTNFLNKIATIATRPEVRGVFWTMAIKVASILSAFTLFTFAARVLGEEEFGRFAMFFSAASMLGVFAVYGQEMLIIRSWNENISRKRFDLAKGSIVFGLGVSAFGGAVCAAAITLYYFYSASPLVAFSAGAFVLVSVFLLFFSSFARTIVSITLGDGQREITAFLIANIVLIACYSLSVALPLVWVINLLTLGMIAAILLQSVCLLRVLRRSYPEIFDVASAFDLPSWRPTSFRLWVASALDTINQYLDVILIGYLLDPIAAGAYFVATRLANGFASVADAFNMFAMRHFPELYYKRDTVGMTKLLQTLSTLTALAVVFGLIFVAFAGHYLLLLFGEEYVVYTHVLLVLCIGTSAMAAAGPAASVLMLTGNETPYLRIVALTVFLRIAGLVLVTPLFGIVGAAAATALSLVVMAFLIGFKSWTATGLNVSATRILRSGRRLPQQTGENC